VKQDIYQKKQKGGRGREKEEETGGKMTLESDLLNESRK